MTHNRQHRPQQPRRSHRQPSRLQQRQQRQRQQRDQSGTSRREQEAHQEAHQADQQHQAQVSRIMGGQLAPEAAQGGVRALLRCPACGRAWLMDSAEPHGARLMLTDQEIADLARDLHADLGQLPYATCRACAALHGIGEIQIDQYADRAGIPIGYGISWEGADPPGAHLLCTALQIQGAQRMHEQGGSPRAGVVTDFPRCRSWLRWLAALEQPRQYIPITPAASAAIAARNPPGHGAPDTDGWRWCGATWLADCPPLGGQVLCTFAQAMPPHEPFSLSMMFALWRVLGGIVLEGHITGEEGATDDREGKRQ